VGVDEELQAEGAAGGRWGCRQRANVSVDFKGEKRSNETHCSTTDPDAMLYRKGPGMEAKLCYIGHGLMENRSGLIVDTRLTGVSGHPERLALDMIQHHADRPVAITLGADKSYETADFAEELRALHVPPHVAQNTNGRRSAIDRRTTRHPGYGALVRRVDGTVRSRSCGLAQQSRQAHEVVGCGDEGEGRADAVEAAQHRAAEPANGLHPAEGFLDAPANALAGRVDGMARGASVDSRASTMARQVLATCGRTSIERSSLTKSATSYSLSAPSVNAIGRSARGSIIARAAMRSAWPFAAVRQVSTTRPERFSISAWPRKPSLATMPGPLR
jgi:hypothetical protein